MEHGDRKIPHVLGIQILCLDGLDPIHLQVKDTNATRSLDIFNSLDTRSVAVSGKLGRLYELAPGLDSLERLARHKIVGFSLGLPPYKPLLMYQDKGYLSLAGRPGRVRDRESKGRRVLGKESVHGDDHHQPICASPFSPKYTEDISYLFRSVDLPVPEGPEITSGFLRGILLLRCSEVYCDFPNRLKFNYLL